MTAKGEESLTQATGYYGIRADTLGIGQKG